MSYPTRVFGAADYISRVWVTNPRLHPQRLEYIRPAEMPDVDPQDIGLWKLEATDTKALNLQAASLVRYIHETTKSSTRRTPGISPPTRSL